MSLVNHYELQWYLYHDTLEVSQKDLETSDEDVELMEVCCL